MDAHARVDRNKRKESSNAATTKHCAFTTGKQSTGSEFTFACKIQRLFSHFALLFAVPLLVLRFACLDGPGADLKPWTTTAISLIPIGDGLATMFDIKRHSRTTAMLTRKCLFSLGLTKNTPMPSITLLQSGTATDPTYP